MLLILGLGPWHIALLGVALFYSLPFIAGALGSAYAVGREIRDPWLAVVAGGTLAVMFLWASIVIAIAVLWGTDGSWIFVAIWLGLLSAPVFGLGGLTAWLGKRNKFAVKVLTS